MKRLSFLIPRLIILALLSLALWLAKDPLLRRAFVHYGERLNAAKVELGQLQTDLGQSRVLLKNIRLADSRNPMTNLFQADMAYLKLDAGQLWNKKFVVTEGQIHGLMVNAPRTESGALKSPPGDSGAVGLSDDLSLQQARLRATSALERISQDWLNQIDTRATPVATISDLESRSKDLQTQWRARLNEFAAQAGRLEPELAALQKSLGAEHQFVNPLRDRQRFEGSLKQLETLQQQAVDLKSQVEDGLRSLDQEWIDFQNLLEHDLNQVQPDPAANHFDEALISELLLTQDGYELVSDIATWLIWFRNTIPEAQLAPTGPRAGVEFHFGPVATPDLTLNKIDLEGSGWFARQHLNFIGTAYNLSTQPHLQQEPTRIDLKALGKGNVLINCVVDRTQGNQVDQLRVQFPDLEFSPRQVGHENSMLVTFGNGRRANADISLQVTADEVAGTVALRFSQASLHVDSLNQLVGGEDTRLRINQALSQLNQFKATLAISGTLERFNIKLESDLGQQFGQIVDNSVIERVAQQNQKLRSSLQLCADQTKSVAESEIRTGLTQLIRRLSQDTTRLANLQQALQQAEETGWSKLR